jgi:hypothetical protein
VADNGTESSLSFVARLAKSFPRSGKFGDFDVRRLTFSVEAGPEYSQQLVLRQNPLLMEMDVDEQNHPLVLAKNVKEFKLEFWDERMGDFIDDWKQTNQLPKLVKVSLKLVDNPHSLQPPEVIERVISLPSIMVPPIWQTPRPMGAPPGAPGAPGAPGTPGAPGAPGPTTPIPITPINPGFPGQAR